MKKIITLLVLLISLTINAQTYEIKGHKQFHAKNEVIGNMNNLTFRNVKFDGLTVTDTVKISKDATQLLFKELCKDYRAGESFTIKAEHKKIKVSYYKHKGYLFRKVEAYSDNQHSLLPYLTNRQFKILFGI